LAIASSVAVPRQRLGHIVRFVEDESTTRSAKAWFTGRNSVRISKPTLVAIGGLVKEVLEIG